VEGSHLHQFRINMWTMDISQNPSKKGYRMLSKDKTRRFKFCVRSINNFIWDINAGKCKELQ
jgi:hypothetical protein